MNSIAYFKERFDQWQPDSNHNGFGAIRREAFSAFSRLGIPTSKNEEWKYTRVAGLFNRDYQFPSDPPPSSVTVSDINSLRLPGYEQANELVFINGFFSFALSVIRSSGLTIQPLEEAAKNEFRELVAKEFGDSNKYIKDGIHALNTAFVHGAVFIQVKKDHAVEHPLYVYNITDARSANILAQPRSLIHINENAQVQMVETYMTLGDNQSFTNQVMEVTVEKDARLEYYKIQNDGDHTNQVSTTHIRQTGKSYVHTVTISLNGGLVRNNLNLILDARYCEAHLYGLYFQTGTSHIDNHTIVDNLSLIHI